MTPQELQQVAQLRAMALRGQEPQQMTQEADVLSGIGGALAGWGGKTAKAISDSSAGRGDALRQLANQQTLATQHEAGDSARSIADLASRRDIANSNNAAEMERVLAQIGAQKEKAKGDKASQDQKTEEDLRNKYIGLDPIKSAMSSKTFYSQIANAPATGTGDLSMIYGLAKMYDPQGRVTDSDAEQAAKTGGLPGQLQGYYNTIAAKGTLSAAARADMKKEAARLFKDRISATAPLRNSYRDLATQYGVSPDRVAIPLGFEDDSAGPVAAATSPATGPVQLPDDEASADAAFARLPKGAKYVGPDKIVRTK